MNQQCFASGLGIATKNRAGEVIEVYYPFFGLGDQLNLSAVKKKKGSNQESEFTEVTPQALSDLEDQNLKKILKTTRPLVVTVLELDRSPTSIAGAFLKLHLLSQRLVKPNQINLEGIFKVLKNLAWTTEGPIDLHELKDRQVAARLAGKPLRIASVDKFPPLLDYVVPSGVRIGDGARVRLGAYLGEGTTVMHEGFVNFNAGCIGPNMIEGRISAGVIVDSGTDLGGGSSTMGTLSGGNQTLIAIGKRCLVGANGGVGIPLGDDCIIEAGLYVTAGAKVAVFDRDGKVIETVKARDLANRHQLLFIRNSKSGALECHPNKKAVDLNRELHDNG